MTAPHSLLLFPITARTNDLNTEVRRNHPQLKSSLGFFLPFLIRGISNPALQLLGHRLSLSVFPPPGLFPGRDPSRTGSPAPGCSARASRVQETRSASPPARQPPQFPRHFPSEARALPPAAGLPPPSPSPPAAPLRSGVCPPCPRGRSPWCARLPGAAAVRAPAGGPGRPGPPRPTRAPQTCGREASSGARAPLHVRSASRGSRRASRPSAAGNHRVPAAARQAGAAPGTIEFTHRRLEGPGRRAGAGARRPRGPERAGPGRGGAGRRARPDGSSPEQAPPARGPVSVRAAGPPPHGSIPAGPSPLPTPAPFRAGNGGRRREGPTVASRSV